MKVFAKKIGTTHLYDENNRHQVATVLELKKTILAKLKTQEKDGYLSAVMVLDDPKAKPLKSIINQFKGLNPKKIMEERLKEEQLDSLEIGREYKADDFEEGDTVSISAKSKGKGFQGTVKRHNFNTGPKSHGSHNYRAPGSIGATSPSRVIKGRKMPGHMGSEQMTQKKLKVIRVDKENNHIWIKGQVVGPNKAIIIIQK